ncbi:MAG: thioredoxin fold domain-containing protein [Gammaproteobacteria bacterium]|nr:thioredoxin fold domain-containing protein [Gammaproteobacteria bacterium]
MQTRNPPVKKLVNIFTIILLVSFFASVQAKEEGALETGMVNPGYHEQPAWFKNSFLDINEDIAEARANGKRLMLFFYQDGCPYCKKLFEDNFGQRSIAEKTRNNFDVVSINLWGDRDVNMGELELTEKAFAEKLKVMYTPTLIFFNEEGKAVLRANGYYHPGKFNAALDYVLERHDKKENFRSYLERVSPAAAAGVMHREVETEKQPYRFDKKPRADYRLVLFEQKECKTCDELHLDILKRKESRELIKPFDVAVLDMWSDEKIVRPDGKQVKIRDWAKQLNVQYAPSMIYFNKKGEEVFRTEAYLRSFHIQSIMDYVATGAYKTQANFQRYIDDRAHKLREKGIEVDIMN